MTDAFDPDWYAAAYPDVAAAGLSPHDHFTRFGQAEGRWPARPEAPGLEDDLWAGFEAEAEPALRALADGPEGANRDWANWALARRAASLGDWAEADRRMTAFRAGGFGAALIGGPGPPVLAVLSAARVGARRRAAQIVAEETATRGPLHELRLAGAAARGRARDAVAALNAVYAEAGRAAVRLRLGRAPALDRLMPGRPAAAPENGPQVSVIVPAYRAEAVIDTALAGLRAQSWRNLEILVVDDGSPDGTRAVAERHAEADERVKMLPAARNQGAYPARNLGLAAAAGAFVTVHDADDWSHPEKIAAQVAPLIERDDLMATVSHWCRATPELGFTRWRVEPEGLVHRNVSSLMIRAELRERLGYWDRVKVNADTEYYYRVQRAFGPAAIAEVLPGVPMALGRVDPASLTQAGPTHARTQHHGLRHDYHQAALRWHERASTPEDLYLPQHPARRPFDIPEEIGLGDPPAALTDDDIIRHSALFDGRWYLSSYEDVRRAGRDPALHYLESGAAQGRDPSPLFSTTGYRLANDTGEANPLLHWETEGRAAGLPARPVFEGQARVEGPVLLVFAHQANQVIFGAERSLLDMLGRFAAEGWAAHAVLPAVHNPDYMDMIRAQAAAVHVLPYRWRRAGRAPHPDTLAAMADLIEATGAREVHVNTLVLDAPLLAARQAGVPGIAHVRELLDEDPDLCATLGEGPAEARAWLLAHADRFVANSPPVAKWLACPERTEVHLNPIDPALFELPPPVPEGPVRVAMISSNVTKKGIADFVAMARALQGRGVDLRCLLIGPETPDLAALRPLPDNVETPGYIDSPAAALSNADIVVSLSKFAESFGRTVTEAMAAARPVVCYARGMPQELVQDGQSGRVVPADDPEAAATAVADMVADPDRLARMGAAARTRARELRQG
ncbi:glycosyltransferase involved in cell wall biosynthesis [Rhodovulum iodosum]|uniref:Glycosyltransferase involved in cell wall biosynthesis n=1 Tax=Rhodovulum iodosum TaxID=68291 RepID=A0ABV3XUQ9_9RHOB|nr:glycosyltransferase [Rhodovulum robiginosum]RSK30476.1 glycosyltransferase [Rhodovulum robiginosum]